MREREGEEERGKREGEEVSEVRRDGGERGEEEERRMRMK
jgi:hypothetical protein